MTYFKMKMTFDSHKTPSEHTMIHHILEHIPIYGKCTIKFPAIFLCCIHSATIQIAIKLSTLQVCETNTTTFKDLGLTWTDCDEAEDYVVPNVVSPRDLVFRPDIMDETVKSSPYTRNNLKSKSVASRDAKLYPVERSSKLTSKISVCMCVIEMYKLYMDFSTASLITLSLSVPSCFVCVWGAEGFTE